MFATPVRFCALIPAGPAAAKRECDADQSPSGGESRVRREGQ